MKSSHRNLLAILLSVGVIIGWYAFFNPAKDAAKRQPAPEAGAVADTAPTAATEATAKKQEEAKQTEQAVAEAEDVTTKKADPQADVPEQQTTMDTELVHVVFSNKGGVPVTWQLKGYSQGTKKDSPPLDMAYAGEGLPPSMDVTFDQANFAIPEEPTYRLVSTKDNEVVYEWASPEATVVKTIALGKDGYTADVTVKVINNTNKTLTATPTLTMSGLTLPAKKSGFFSFLKQPPATNKSPAYYLDGKVHRENKVAKIPAAQVVASDPNEGGGLYWSGLEDRYFISAVIPRKLSSDVKAVIGAKKLPSEGKGAWGVYSGASQAPLSVVPNSSAEVTFTTYMGPKEINYLKAVDVHLDKAINYGWFTIIAIPILYLLKMFYTVVRNYGVAIILLTIFIKLLLHPINVKSMKSMKAMQQLQPKLKELQAKYKGNKEKLNVETMQLFKAHKVNPMGGCLPMIAQFPIYIALYKVLWNSIELYHAPFFWFYRDLSAPDPYMITPILLGIGMVLQQKIMPSATADPSQKKMMMIMPVMFSIFMIFLPVGLVVYILVNTTMSVTQQWMYNNGIRMRDVVRLRFKTNATS